jgi:hypothetical protein
MATRTVQIHDRCTAPGCRRVLHSLPECERGTCSKCWLEKLPPEQIESVFRLLTIVKSNAKPDEVHAAARDAIRIFRDDHSIGARVIPGWIKFIMIQQPDAKEGIRPLVALIPSPDSPAAQMAVSVGNGSAELDLIREHLSALAEGRNPRLSHHVVLAAAQSLAERLEAVGCELAIHAAESEAA